MICSQWRPEEIKKCSVVQQLRIIPSGVVKEGNLIFQSHFHKHLHILGSVATEKNLEIVL